MKKINWPREYEKYLDLYEIRRRDQGQVKASERRMGVGENILTIKGSWPMITENGNNATEKYFFFRLKVKPNAPPEVLTRSMS